MNNNLLNATPFVGSPTFRSSELEILLGCCVDIYTEMTSNNNLCENNEEKIRDCFFNYLNDDNYRRKVQTLENYHFEKEPQENTGYLDIKIKTLNPYKSTKAYYIIECKRLDSNNLKGATGLNAEYVKNGICRFVTGYYSSYFRSNAMLGFLVRAANIQTDIVDNINLMLNTNFTNTQREEVNANATQQMQYENFANGYLCSYISKHTRVSGDELVLYHLIFDLSKNVI